MEEEYIHVACPGCKNKRLFDLQRGSKGIISIKCQYAKLLWQFPSMMVAQAIITGRIVLSKLEHS